MSNVKMPEPAATVEEVRLVENVNLPIGADLFTADQMQAYGDARAKESVSLTDWQVKELAHRGAFLFKQATDPGRSDTYTFNEYCLLDFARAILHAATLQQEKQG